MGGSISTGVDNDEMIDNLAKSQYIRTPTIEKVFRSVDRAFYFLPEFKHTAYRDLAWKQGNLHLSAPCIYSAVLEHLKLKPGHSFLNIGSGTGYLSTLAGLILGPYGTNHGIEVHSDVVDYAYEKLEQFKKKCCGIDVFEFCEPVFVVGNGFNLNHDRRYDRIYCGAACPAVHQEYIIKLLKVGGILVLPCEDDLLKIVRTSEDFWDISSVLPVSFSTLQFPDRENSVMISTPDPEPLCLQELCRSSIRSLLRAIAEKEEPELTQKRKCKQSSLHRSFPGEDNCLVIPVFSDTETYRQYTANLHTVAFERLIRNLGRNYRTLNGHIDTPPDSGNEDSDTSVNSETNNDDDGSVEPEEPKQVSSKRDLIDDSEASTSNGSKCAKISEGGSSKVNGSSSKEIHEKASRTRRVFTFNQETGPRRIARYRVLKKIVPRSEYGSENWSSSVEDQEESASENQPNKVIKREKLDSGFSEESDDSKVSISNESSFSDTMSNEPMEMESDSDQQCSPCEHDESSDIEESGSSVNDSVPLKYRLSLEKKIKILPLPNAIKSYLNYNREFCISY